MTARSLKRLERAAMRWYRWLERDYPGFISSSGSGATRALGSACAAHAKKPRGKGKGKAQKATRSLYDANGLKEYSGE